MTIANIESMEARAVRLRRVSGGRATCARRLRYRVVAVHGDVAERAPTLAMSSNVVMVATSARSSGADADCTFAAVIAINARVGVWVREFDAALLAWMLVRVADLESWVCEAG